MDPKVWPSNGHQPGLPDKLIMLVNYGVKAIVRAQNMIPALASIIREWRELNGRWIVHHVSPLFDRANVERGRFGCVVTYRHNGGCYKISKLLKQSALPDRFLPDLFIAASNMAYWSKLWFKKIPSENKTGSTFSDQKTASNSRIIARTIHRSWSKAEALLREIMAKSSGSKWSECWSTTARWFLQPIEGYSNFGPLKGLEGTKPAASHLLQSKL